MALTMHAGIIGTREVTLVLDDLAPRRMSHRVLVPAMMKEIYCDTGLDASEIMTPPWREMAIGRRATYRRRGSSPLPSPRMVEPETLDAAKQLAEPLDHRAPPPSRRSTTRPVSKPSPWSPGSEANSWPGMTCWASAGSWPGWGDIAPAGDEQDRRAARRILRRAAADRRRKPVHVWHEDIKRMRSGRCSKAASIPGAVVRRDEVVVLAQRHLLDTQDGLRVVD